MLGRRHAALGAAAGWTRLGLEPATRADVVLRMMPADDPLVDAERREPNDG